MAGAGIHPFHQQWPPAAAAPPPPGAPASVAVPPPPPVPGAPGTADEVRTIFITGLPVDVKERELHNLLRWLPGFEASQINFKGDQPMGFALFASAHQAVAAKAALQDLVFDGETNSKLHTEMAKKNLFVKRGVGTDANAVDQSKRLRTGGDYTHSPYAPPPFHPPPPAVSMWGTAGYIAAPPPYNPYGYPVPPVAMTSPSPVPGPTAYAPVQNTKDNPPCNTLFIGNLGETVVEEELRSLFSVQPGFKQMKVLRQDRNTVCFIEFEDVNAATAVHHTLQGAVIPSSGRGGMRIQYPSLFYFRIGQFDNIFIGIVQTCSSLYFLYVNFEVTLVYINLLPLLNVSNVFEESVWAKERFSWRPWRHSKWIFYKLSHQRGCILNFSMPSWISCHFILFIICMLLLNALFSHV